MEPETSTLSESEALRLAQQHNSAAFEFLYRLHCGRVYALCLRMVKNPAQAEDLTQETFLAVFRGIREFRGQSAFTTWLHRVTRNTVLMCFRKRRLNETSLEEITEPDRESGRLPTELGIPDRRLESMADRLLLRTAVSQLSRRLRRTLLLHDVYGYEHGEVAAMMGCATGTSKSQLHKAHLRIREMLKKRLRDDKHSQNPANRVSVGVSGSLPPPGDDQFDSVSEKASALKDPPRKSERTAPSWCVPIDEVATGSE